MLWSFMQFQGNKSDLIIKNTFNKMGEYRLFLNESLDFFFMIYT